MSPPPPPPPPPSATYPRWVGSTVLMVLTAVGTVLSILDQIPDWTVPAAVLVTGGFAWFIVNRDTPDPARKVRYVTLIAILTCLLTYGLSAHQWPRLAGIDQVKTVADPANPARTTAPKLTVTSLRDGQRIPRCINVEGTGAIPADTQIWVAHANDDEGGAPAETLMNFQRAKNIEGRPALWQTGRFLIGDEVDSRSFWIYVYALPAEAGHVLEHHSCTRTVSETSGSTGKSGSTLRSQEPRP